MKTFNNLWKNLCSYENVYKAFLRARKGKTKKAYVKEFEADFVNNLSTLRTELLLHSYQPEPLKTFIIRDPKTRKISKSAFRDRIVHHALINILEPIFDKRFIFDSYANRKSKGTLKAIQRFDKFKRKVTKNGAQIGYVLKADIRHYFDEVDQGILLDIIKKRIKDERVLWLIKKILDNHHPSVRNKGMPLGNLTSQFFANVYLDELDQFVKHSIGAKYYIRYVDDFVILHERKEILDSYRSSISHFLQTELALTLHSLKSRITQLDQGIDFLGFRIFYHHKLLRKMNERKMNQKYKAYKQLYKKGVCVYDKIYNFLQGWCVYAKHGNTFNVRMKLLKRFEADFSQEIASVEINRLLKYPRRINIHEERLIKSRIN